MGGEEYTSVEEQAILLRLREAAARVDVEEWVRRDPVAAIVGALLAGFIVGSSPRTVQALAETLLQFIRKIPTPMVPPRPSRVPS